MQGDVQPIERVDRSGDLPLSFAQERLWFIDQLAPGGYAYNMPMAIRLQGELDVSALERSVATIVSRHETLRTRFDSRDGRPRRGTEPTPSRAA